MDIDVQDLVLIEEIENAGSFSGAANRLYRTRSAITQHVQKLEDRLGFLIFDRSHYRPLLTPEGQLFLERGRPFLRGFQKFKSDVSHIQQGWESTFSIAVDDVLGIESLFFLIEEFRKVAPQVTLRLVREVLNGCWDALTNNRSDLAIGASGEPPFDFICKQDTMGFVDFIYAVGKDHPLAKLQGMVTPEILSVYPRIVVSDTSSQIPKRTTGIVSQQAQIIVPTMADKIAAQVQGLGIGYVPQPRVQHLLDAGDLIPLELTSHAKKRSEFKVAWIERSDSRSLDWFLKALSHDETKHKILSFSKN